MYCKPEIITRTCIHCKCQAILHLPGLVNLVFSENVDYTCQQDLVTTFPSHVSLLSGWEFTQFSQLNLYSSLVLHRSLLLIRWILPTAVYCWSGRLDNGHILYNVVLYALASRLLFWKVLSRLKPSNQGRIFTLTNIDNKSAPLSLLNLFRK